jgi:hypothetical protein
MKRRSESGLHSRGLTLPWPFAVVIPTIMSITKKGLQGIVLVFSIAVMRITWAQDTMLPTPVVQLGTIVDIVMNSAKERVEGAVITATSASGIRSSISGSDGVDSFADVPPGVSSLTITVEGSADTVKRGARDAGASRHRDERRHTPKHAT